VLAYKRKPPPKFGGGKKQGIDNKSQQ